MIQNLRNIAIIAHVDHGKTTLVDKLLQQSGTLDARAQVDERMMDSNALEKERGITILAKNTAIRWTNPADGIEYRINIVDTPGHADFGGEVERVLSMVDSVLLLVDAVDTYAANALCDPKAFSHGLKPIVVINKIDRPGADPAKVMDQVFSLFDNLGATDEQLDFPVVYASALNGFAGLEEHVNSGDMTPLFQTIIKHVAAPDVEVDAPFQMQISSLDYNPYLGIIGIGRIKQGKIRSNTQIKAIDVNGAVRGGRILKILGFHGLERIEVPEAQAGDIIAFSGMDELYISDTICDPDNVVALPPLTIDEPTVTMTFQVNTSPFSGKEVKTGTSSRRLQERLAQELLHNVALRVEPTDDPENSVSPVVVNYISVS